MTDTEQAATVAARIADDVHALNYATMAGAENGPVYPSDVYDIVGSLDTALMRLPQAFAQLGRFLLDLDADGRVRLDHDGNPTAAVLGVQFHLDAAAAAIAQVREQLQAAYGILSPMSYAADEDGPDNDRDAWAERD